jgi:hypothetical protein
MELSATASGGYPVDVWAERQESYHRWLPLVKWLLAIPHYFVLILLLLGVVFSHFIALFAVLFTRRYPRGIFDYIVAVFSWGWRVQAYVGLLRDEYPPFSLRPPEPYPAELVIEYPEDGIDRWRPLVHWLLAIPYLFVAHLLNIVSRALLLVAFFAILFTEQFPQGLFNLVIGATRWGTRAFAYALFMVDRYPPWDFDELTAPPGPRPGSPAPIAGSPPAAAS